jgi:hypothetical protein
MVTFIWPAVNVTIPGVATEATLSAINTKITTTANGIKVDGSAVTQPISAASLPLPAGASTEATLAALNTKVTTTASGIKVDGSATTQPVSGTVAVSNFPATQPISAVSLPLPTGAATSANQTTANTSLSSIDTKTPALGQALAASSVPVVLTAAQLTTLTPFSSVSVSNFPASQAVTGTFFQATQPVSAVSLPLPTGAATSSAQTSLQTTLSSIDTKTPSFGQALMLNSSPVVIASNQTAIPVTFPDGTSQTTTGNFSTPGQFIQLNTNGASIVSFRTTGTWTGLIGVSASVDGTTFDLLPLYDFTGQTSQTYSGGNTPFSANVGGFKVVRILAVTLTSGTAAVAAWLNPGQGPQICLSPAPGGFYTTSNLRDGSSTPITSSTVNSKQAIDVAIQSGSGRSKVALARIDYTSTSVTTAAYTQLVASTSAQINKLQIFDSSGQTLVLAVGAAASEVDQIYILPGGQGDTELKIASGSRISVKAVSATASVGELTINFLS